MLNNQTHIYGRHAIMEAAQYRPDTLGVVFLAEDSKDGHLKSVLMEAKIETQAFNPKHKKLPGDVPNTAVHQGVIAELLVEKLMQPYKEFIETIEPSPDTALLILAEVQDPHNVGAAIRSAAAFGITAVLMPPHNQAPVTGSVVKVSAGMTFRVPLVAIGNVNTTIRDLKERGYWIYGLDGRGDTEVTKEQFDRPTVFVLGNEGEGLRKMTAEACDTLIKIPMHSRCESLNASASTAAMLYAWSAQHPEALK